MPRDHDYLTVLTDGIARARYEYVTEGKRVIQFVAQLEAMYGGRWKPVKRYDDAHGRPHIDLYTSQGEHQKIWLDVDSNEALTLAEQDFKMNWERYVDDFLGG